MAIILSALLIWLSSTYCSQIDASRSGHFSEVLFLQNLHDSLTSYGLGLRGCGGECISFISSSLFFGWSSSCEGLVVSIPPVYVLLFFAGFLPMVLPSENSQ